MAQIIDPIPSNNSDKILCCYVNATSKIQIARITNIPNWYFERVVFPGQRLMFEALPEALLEIHTGMMASAILSDTLPCHRLALEDVPQSLVEDADVENIHSTSSLSATTESQTVTSAAVAPLSVGSAVGSVSAGVDIGRIA